MYQVRQIAMLKLRSHAEHHRTHHHSNTLDFATFWVKLLEENEKFNSASLYDTFTAPIVIEGVAQEERPLSAPTPPEDAEASAYHLAGYEDSHGLESALQDELNMLFVTKTKLGSAFTAAGEGGHHGDDSAGPTRNLAQTMNRLHALGVISDDTYRQAHGTESEPTDAAGGRSDKEFAEGIDEADNEAGDAAHKSKRKKHRKHRHRDKSKHHHREGDEPHQTEHDQEDHEASPHEHSQHGHHEKHHKKHHRHRHHHHHHEKSTETDPETPNEHYRTRDEKNSERHDEHHRTRAEKHSERHDEHHRTPAEKDSERNDEHYRKPAEKGRYDTKPLTAEEELPHARSARLHKEKRNHTVLRLPAVDIQCDSEYSGSAKFHPNRPILKKDKGNASPSALDSSDRPGNDMDDSDSSSSSYGSSDNTNSNTNSTNSSGYSSESSYSSFSEASRAAPDPAANYNKAVQDAFREKESPKEKASQQAGWGRKRPSVPHLNPVVGHALPLKPSDGFPMMGELAHLRGIWPYDTSLGAFNLALKRVRAEKADMLKLREGRARVLTERLLQERNLELHERVPYPVHSNSRYF